ncbi:MAG: phosphate acyltransferase PlsX [Candidatus Synoicihabitans palmerolidicus]|nr:phosphate acyltransferase PlsX [Candidatus Synoicihabitans palmerolidicus]
MSTSEHSASEILIRPAILTDGNPQRRTRRIALDAMGGDMGPGEVVSALQLALQEFGDLCPVTIIGDEAQLSPLLGQAKLTNHPKVSLLHASEVITMADKVMTAIKRKRDSSMLKAIELVNEGEARAVISTGNTRILVSAGTLKLRTLAGVERPALSPVIPREGGHFILIDTGANPEANPVHLVHNAILGSHYAHMKLGIEKPRVGLLTIGTEEGKGNAVINGTHESLKSLGNLVNYVGPVEGFQVFLDHVDVIVCDGFTGNICLKSWESLSKFFRNELKAQMLSSPLRRLGGLLARGAFTGLRHRIQPERYGGAPLLGLRGTILKAHGSANRYALMNALGDASEFIREDRTSRIEADIDRANKILLPEAVDVNGR